MSIIGLKVFNDTLHETNSWLVQHRASDEIRRLVSEASRDIRALCDQPFLQRWNPRHCAYALA